jgi:heme-degrading monooxygenase HmoA
MYIAINRFKINRGQEDAFENMWQRRETHLDNVPGFIKFHLAKGNSEQTHTLYISHSTWHSKEDFTLWTKSEAFRLAHKGAGKHSDIYQGHPIFEGFEVILGD